MCTLVLAHRCFPNVPLAIAANRDEFLDRAASPPAIVEGTPRILMPRDEVAGGTWLGLNAQGLFVGITNRAGTPPDKTRQSRGNLVVDALHAPDATRLHRRLEATPPDRYNPFHLMYADPQAAFVTWCDGAALHQYAIEPGVHIVTERSLGGDDHRRTERLNKLFADNVSGREPTFESLHQLLAVHGPEGDPFAGSCVHADAHRYGTRSGFVYLGGSPPRAWWMEGHPCEAAPRELAELMGIQWLGTR